MAHFLMSHWASRQNRHTNAARPHLHPTCGFAVGQVSAVQVPFRLVPAQSGRVPSIQTINDDTLKPNGYSRFRDGFLRFCEVVDMY